MPEAFDLMVQKMQIAQNQGHNLAVAKVYKNTVSPALIGAFDYNIQVLCAKSWEGFGEWIDRLWNL